MFKFNEIESLSYHNKEIKFYTPTKKTAGRVKKIFRKEPITITWMDNMKQGDIVIDIGANVGMYSLMSAVSRSVRVYAFEPEASNYNILCQNIRLNDFIKTHLIVSGSTFGEDISGFKLPERYVLVLGNEAHGISKNIEPLIQKSVSIKKLGEGESLNLSSAASILMYSLTRKR